jgi:hypothetical protein
MPTSRQRRLSKASSDSVEAHIGGSNKKMEILQHQKESNHQWTKMHRLTNAHEDSP